MRLLVATSSYPVQGNPVAGKFVRTNVEALEAKDIQCTVLRPGPAKNTESPEFQPAIVEVPIREEGPGSFLGVGFPETFQTSPLPAFLDLLRCIRGMGRELYRRRHEADAILAHWAVPAGLAAVLASYFPIGASSQPPILLWLHSSDVYALERLPGGNVLARILHARSKFIFAVSRDLALRFSTLSGNPKTITVMHPGIPTSHAPPPPPSKSLRAIFVGRLESIKGVELIPYLARQMPDWHFTIVGAGSQLGKVMASSTQLENLQIIPGLPPEQVRDEIIRNNLLILPGSRHPKGRTEGLPTVLLEALDAGRPVIAPRSGGVEELVTKECGYLVEPGSKKEILNALQDYEQDLNHWSERTPKLHQRAESYSAKAAATRIYGLLKTLQK